MNVTITHKSKALELFSKFPETQDIITLRKALSSKPRYGEEECNDTILLTDIQGQEYNLLANPIINANAGSRHGSGKSLILALPETPIYYIGVGGQDRYGFTLLCKDPDGKGFAIILQNDLSRYWGKRSSDWEEDDW